MGQWQVTIRDNDFDPENEVIEAKLRIRADDRDHAEFQASEFVEMLGGYRRMFIDEIVEI